MAIETLSDWLGDPRQIEVERALGEFRAARPVEIRSGRDALLAFPAESLDETVLKYLAIGQEVPRLVVSQARLKNRFGWNGGNGRITLTPFNTEAITAFLDHHGHDGSGVSLPYSVEIAAPNVLEDAALTLANLSLLLPAVAVVDARQFTHSQPSPILTVKADWITDYRDCEANSLQLVARTVVPLEGVDHAEFVIFRGGDGFRDHVAVLISKPSPHQPVLTRIHSACLTGDLFGSLKCDCGDQLRGTVQHMSELGGGIVLYLDQEGRGNGIANKIRAYHLQAEGFDTYDADEILGFGFDQRRFDFAAEMLKQLGYHSIKLMTNNPEKIDALREAGLEVVSTHRVLARHNPHNVKYLAAKRDKAGHLLGDVSLDGEEDAGPALKLAGTGHV